MSENHKPYILTFPGDWKEDFGLENGSYLNICVVCKDKFVGHKRRCVCKICDDKAAAAFEALTDDQKQEQQRIFARQAGEWMRNRDNSRDNQYKR
jgi:hypothetical protein